MRTTELRALLDEVADTRELVLRRPRVLDPSFDALHGAWSDAHEEAAIAYSSWRRSQRADDYLVYRAAQDREDAAQDVLALRR